MARKADTARKLEIALQAFDVIKTKGIYSTTMSDIAAALGMKRPTLYWYFKDFGEIFKAVIAHTDAALRSHVLAQVAGIEHPLDTLAALVAASIEFYASRADEITVMFQLWSVSGHSGPGDIAERARQFVQPVRDELAARLQRGIDDGLVAPCEPEVIVALAMAVIDGAHVQQVTGGRDPKPLVDGLRRYVLEPLRCAAPPARVRRSDESPSSSAKEGAS